VTIEVFAELACPFTHLGLRRIVERRTAQGRTRPRLRVRPWPLELVNGQPLDPPHVAAEVRAMRTQVAPDLFVGFDETAFPSSSMGGFRLVEAAYALDLDLGERVGLALRDALFEEGRDIGDPAVLAGVGAAHGVEVPGRELDDEVRAAYEEGQRRGVQGSPHFFVADTSAFCPLLDIRRDDAGDFHLRLDEDAAGVLLDGWFAMDDTVG
jgi:predicted DsbA family dithiol-disulfide isomerase